MMTIKAAWFYAALAASLGAGYGGGVALTQRDLAEMARSVQCEDDSGKPKFDTTTRPMNSKGKGF